MNAKHVSIPSKFQYQVIEHVARNLPEEACGLLAGCEGVIKMVIPIENLLHSPERFRMEAKAQLDAFSLIEKHKMVVVAIFHSHPNGPGCPSETDIREHAYPGVLSIICFLDEKGQWYLKAFNIMNGASTPYSIL